MIHKPSFKNSNFGLKRHSYTIDYQEQRPTWNWCHCLAHHYNSPVDEDK